MPTACDGDFSFLLFLLDSEVGYDRGYLSMACFELYF